MWPWCLCLRSWGSQVPHSTNFACGVGMPLLPWQATKEPSSTPPVVPGAAPALAKAGVGRFTMLGGWDYPITTSITWNFGCQHVSTTSLRHCNMEWDLLLAGLGPHPMPTLQGRGWWKPQTSQTQRHLEAMKIMKLSWSFADRILRIPPGRGCL